MHGEISKYVLSNLTLTDGQNVILVTTREVVDDIATGVVNIETRVDGIAVGVDDITTGVNELLARVPAILPPPSSNVSHVLPCPPPTHFFVGRDGKIAELSHLFFPVIAIQFKPDEQFLFQTVIDRVQLAQKYAVHSFETDY